MRIGSLQKGGLHEGAYDVSRKPLLWKTAQGWQACSSGNRKPVSGSNGLCMCYPCVDIGFEIFFVVTPRASSARQVSMSKPHINEDDRIWRRRLAKRCAGVQSVKASPEYSTCDPRPATPDPSDRTASKRLWERRMQDFRRGVRNQRPPKPVDRLATSIWSEDIPTNTANFLCDIWLDQRGSVYKLSRGRAGAFHVETTRPGGQMRFTRNLVRNATIRGRAQMIWGNYRYVLEPCDSDALFWRGLSENDVFSWCRIRPEDR